MASSFNIGTETLSFAESLDRILAEDIIADRDMPPFNRAAVDGYACSKEDLSSGLFVIGTIKAGEISSLVIKKGECCKIMTGAMVPGGADFVFMSEDATVLPSGLVSFGGNPAKNNISSKGEDIKAGQTLLKAGKIITPQDIAVMASAGKVAVTVGCKPHVAVISTGDEIVEPDEKPGDTEIRNSNAWQLLAQIQRAGGSGRYYGIAPDEEEATFRIITEAMAESDIVILTGGVSMGDFDFVSAVLERAGVEILFSKIRVQPGKPTTFGRYKGGLVFGLPGNPVSCYVQFEVLVRPLLNKMAGADWKPVIIPLPMAARYERKSTDRAAWIPVIINSSHDAEPVEYHGSAHITALSFTDGLVFMEPGQKLLEKDEKVLVRLI